MKTFYKFVLPLAVFALVASPALGALNLNPGSGVVNPNDAIEGSDVANLVNSVVNWVMGIGIAVGVLMFVWGGIKWATGDAAGGKTLLQNAAIGILAILAVGLVVNTIANVVLKKGQVF